MSDLKNMNSRCSFCVRLFKWIPVLFIASIVAWSYFAFVIQLCFLTIDFVVQKIFYLVLYHGIFAIFMWSYWQTIFTRVGVVPKQFKISPEDAEKLEKDPSEDNQRRLLEAFAKDLPVVCRTLNGSIRYCQKCHNIKPDRSHHCSICGVCVLKMDHHCPWVNNCVSFTNYKFFILFLGYALLYCLFIAATSLPYFILFCRDSLEAPAKYHILFLFLVAAILAFSLISLFAYHCYLVSVNQSTLESFRSPIFRTGPEKDGFSLGRKLNFAEVFGDKKSKWLLPVHSSLGNGVTFTTRGQLGSSYNSMGNTKQASHGDGVVFPQKSVDELSGPLLDERTHWIEDESDDTSKSNQRNIHGYTSNAGSDIRLLIQ